MSDGFTEQLPGGGIAPSYIDLYSASDENDRARLLIDSNPFLKVGYIFAVHFPGDRGYENSKRVLYDVIIPQEGEYSAGNNILYNCRNAYSVGSSTDRDHIIFRTPPQFSGLITEEFKKQTTVVLVLLANGNRATPFIVGVLESEYAEAPSKEDGYNRHFRYNGLDVTINSDGELIVKRMGPTIDAASQDVNASGTTYLKMDKNGSITLSDEDGTIFTVDTTGHKIILDAPRVEVTNKLKVGAGATGIFTSLEGRVVTVKDGIVVDIK